MPLTTQQIDALRDYIMNLESKPSAGAKTAAANTPL